jgi:tetratricopeptide (TPR) repeat protein
MKALQLCLLLALVVTASFARGQKAAPRATGSRSESSANSFKSLVAKAEAARENDQVEEAIRLYRQAVEIRPNFVEGWWYLGMLHYESDQYADGAIAFRHVTGLKPEMALGWAMLGLCQFGTRDYDGALVHLERSDQLGIPSAESFYDVAKYHLVLLRTRSGDFDSAIRLAADFALRNKDGPELTEAMGLAALRKPLLPSELPPLEREMVIDVGHSMCDAAAKRAAVLNSDIAMLLDKYPEVPEIHFLAGTMELGSNPDQALADWKSELDISPANARALASIAGEYLRRKEYTTAMPYAEKAVAAGPENFAPHAILGQVLSEGDLDLARGIHELETAIHFSPGQPQVHFVLAAAYAKAGRKEDAAKERAEFLRLRSQGEVALTKPH